jgi:hypothetical protein
MTVYVVLYFYPDGTFAGVVGGRTDRGAAEALRDETKADYSDCLFSICEVEAK